jgi:hypothetical protein
MTSEELKAEAQDLFDQVVSHLRQQGKRSQAVLGIGLIRCLYRHPDGLKCAVGCLIPDANYEDTMEKQDLHQVLEMLPKELRERLLRHEAMLLDLQHLHDDTKVEMWEAIMAEIAIKNGLVFIGKDVAAVIEANKESGDVPSAPVG